MPSTSSDNRRPFSHLIKQLFSNTGCIYRAASRISFAIPAKKPRHIEVTALYYYFIAEKNAAFIRVYGW